MQASPDAIAASASGAAGDNGVAIQIAQLGRNGVASLGGRSFRDEYTDFASGLGVDAHNAAQDQQTDQSLLDQADSRRTAVSGVSVDEEMTLLIAQQQAYGAAARLITVAEKMLDDLMATMVP